MPPIWKLDVGRDMQLMKAAWAVLIPALGFFLFYFIGEMKDVRRDIGGVDSKVSGQSATLNDMSSALTRIEMRLAPPPKPTRKTPDKRSTASNSGA